jgi:hypothetical protein
VGVFRKKRLNDGKWNVGGGIKKTESAGKRKKEINEETDVKIRREIDKAERQKCFFLHFFSRQIQIIHSIQYGDKIVERGFSFLFYDGDG